MGATDLISEGILIRTSGCTGAGRVARGVMDLLLANVRLAEQLWSDLEVQANVHAVCRRRAQEFLDDHDGPDYKAMDCGMWPSRWASTGPALCTRTAWRSS